MAWDLERKKLLHDYLKHLATVDTGAIVILVAFIDKISSSSEYKIFLGLAFICFLVSLIGCVLVQTVDIWDHEHKENWASNIAILGMLSGLFGFLIGVISLVLFGLNNMF